MANVDKPNGFIPVGTISGAPYTGAIRQYPVDASNATAIFVGDAVELETDGNVIPLSAATTGTPVLGICTGVVVDRSVAATEHPGYLPATTAGTIHVAVGPDILYEVQEDGDTTPMDAASRGANVAPVLGAGSTTTGRSAYEIDSDSITAAASLQFRVVDYVDRVDNEIGSTGARWIVRVHESHLNSTNGI